jgi:hypothetical protein
MTNDNDEIMVVDGVLVDPDGNPVTGSDEIVYHLVQAIKWLWNRARGFFS